MKILTVFTLTLILAVFCLAGCSDNTFTFSPDAIAHVDGESSVDFEMNTLVELKPEGVVVSYYNSDSAVATEGDFSVNTVKIGDDFDTFKKAFGLESNCAVWETCILYEYDTTEVIFNYLPYEGKAIDFDGYDDRFLTVGYKNTGDDKWEVLSYSELESILTFKALSEDNEKLSATDEIYIIGAGFDKKGKINLIQTDITTVEGYIDEYKPEDKEFEWDKVLPQSYTEQQEVEQQPGEQQQDAEQQQPAEEQVPLQ